MNEACLGALGEVRALVGMLREDPMAAGQDESVAGPAATTSLIRLRDRLEEHGVRVRASVLVELDRVSSVTQSTLTRVMEEIVDAVRTSDADGTEVLATIDRRRGWIIMDVHYPDPIVGSSWWATSTGWTGSARGPRRWAEASGVSAMRTGGACSCHSRPASNHLAARTRARRGPDGGAGPRPAPHAVR